MGCNHPVVYVTHGKGERTIALKAVVTAKISRVNSCMKVTKQRVAILRWTSSRITRIFFCSEITVFLSYHHPQTGEGCAVCQVSPIPLDCAPASQGHSDNMIQSLLHVSSQLDFVLRVSSTWDEFLHSCVSIAFRMFCCFPSFRSVWVALSLSIFSTHLETPVLSDK